MENLNFSLQNILDGQGIEISITGMLVVFVALALISSFIALFPAILRVVDLIYPSNSASSNTAVDNNTTEDKTIAAIGFALHSKMGKNIAAKRP